MIETKEKNESNTFDTEILWYKQFYFVYLYGHAIIIYLLSQIKIRLLYKQEPATRIPNFFPISHGSSHIHEHPQVESRSECLFSCHCIYFLPEIYSHGSSLCFFILQAFSSRSHDTHEISPAPRKTEQKCLIFYSLMPFCAT